MRDYASRDKVVVVVSAVSGITDMLISAAHKAAARKQFEALGLVLDVQKKHAEILRNLGLEQSEPELSSDVGMLVADLQNFIQSVSILGEVTPRTLDYISGIGERLSCRLMAAELRSLGCKAEAVEATNFLVTDSNFGNAFPYMTHTQERARGSPAAYADPGHYPRSYGLHRGDRGRELDYHTGPWKRRTTLRRLSAACSAQTKSSSGPMLTE